MVKRLINIYPIAAILFLSSCSAVSLDDLRDDTPVLTGILREGQTPWDFRYFLLQGETGNQFSVPQDAFIHLIDDAGNECDLAMQGDGTFGCDAAYPIVAGGTYSITAGNGTHRLTAQVTIPGHFELLTVNTSTFTPNPNAPNEIAFQFSWEQDPALSYAITLEPLDDNPTPTPFYPSDNFNNQYGLPFLEGQAILRSSYFNYYGPHRITIYAIDKSYEAVFFFNPVADIRSLLNTGLDNVEGGSGYVAGASIVTLNVELLQ